VLQYHILICAMFVTTAISGEKIEIDPVLGKALLFKQKAVTHDTDNIACCSLLDEKHSGRMTYRFSSSHIGGWFCCNISYRNMKYTFSLTNLLHPQIPNDLVQWHLTQWKETKQMIVSMKTLMSHL